MPFYRKRPVGGPPEIPEDVRKLSFEFAGKWSGEVPDFEMRRAQIEGAIMADRVSRPAPLDPEPEGLIEELRQGVVQIATDEDGVSLYAIDDASALMWKAADALSQPPAREAGMPVKGPEEAWAAVYTERHRQISDEGWTPEHDDEHTDGSLLTVAVLYLWHDTDKAARLHFNGIPYGWPWAHKWWKPRDRRSNLVRAGALCVAEHDRRVRARMLTAPADQKLGIVLRELSAINLTPATARAVGGEPVAWRYRASYDNSWQFWPVEAWNSVSGESARLLHPEAEPLYVSPDPIPTPAPTEEQSNG